MAATLHASRQISAPRRVLFSHAICVGTNRNKTKTTLKTNSGQTTMFKTIIFCALTVSWTVSALYLNQKVQQVGGWKMMLNNDQDFKHALAATIATLIVLFTATAIYA